MDYNEFTKKYNIVLNQQQEKAAQIKTGPALLFAVPGSGKTTVIVSRIGYLIYCCSIKPENILTLTFSVAAAKDMKERFKSKFSEDLIEQLKFKTIHSFCVSVISKYVKEFNRKAFDLFSDSNKILNKLYVELFNQFPSDNDIKDILQKIGFCKNMMLSEAEIKEVKMPDIDFYKIYTGYELYKKENKVMDYDDQLKYAYSILKSYPEILEYFTYKYTYLNVDEAQDTSYIQHKIIELLSKKNENIFMVGDEDQSIYGFRAAFPKALLDFDKTYKKAKVLFMETNYRSTGVIVDAANRFIKQNFNRKDKNMTTCNPDGEAIKHTLLNDMRNQYSYICEQVNQNTKDLAILFRNNDSAIPLIDMLQRKGIKFKSKEGSTTYFKHYIVQDIVNFIEFSLNLKDINLFEKIYYKMNTGISKRMLNFIKEFIKINAFESIFDVLIQFEELDDNFIRKIKLLKNKFVRLLGKGPYETILSINYELGYDDYLLNKVEQGYSFQSLNQKRNIMLALSVEAKTINDFLNRIFELENINIQNKYLKNEPSVTISTIHSSKGLEYDKVILIDAVEGIFPSQTSIMNKQKCSICEEFDEEVRLFYVGVTRAKSQLEIISVESQFGVQVKTSQFVTKLLMPKLESRQIEMFKTPISLKLSDYVAGITIEHKVFKKGTIISVNNNTIIAKFENCGDKTFNLVFCVENGLINKTD